MGLSQLLKLPPGVMDSAAGFSITDDFSSDSGLWLDGLLAPAAISVSGNRAIWSPTVGAATYTMPFSAWAGDNPTGWTVIGESAPNVEVTQRGSTQTHAGDPAETGAANVYNDGTNTLGRPQLRDYNSLTVGLWYEVQAACTAWAAGKYIWGSALAASGGRSAYDQVTGVATATGVDIAFDPGLFGEGYEPFDMTFDSLQASPVTVTTMVRVQQMLEISWVASNIWYPSFHPLGHVLWKDSNNYIFAYLRESTDSLTTASDIENAVALVAIVGGAVSSFTQATVTHSVGSQLALVPNTTFTGFSVNYGGSEVISEQAISDFAGDVDGKGFGELTPWYGGLLCGKNAGNYNTCAFGSFQMQSVF